MTAGAVCIHAWREEEEGEGGKVRWRGVKVEGGEVRWREER